MSKNPSVNPTSHTEATATQTSLTGNKTGDNTTTGRFGQAKQTLTRSAEKVGQGFSTVGRGVSKYAGNAASYAQSNPGRALAIAIGSGIAIGYLVGRSRRRNSIFNILSQAVVETITDRIR